MIHNHAGNHTISPHLCQKAHRDYLTRAQAVTSVTETYLGVSPLQIPWFTHGRVHLNVSHSFVLSSFCDSFSRLVVFSLQFLNVLIMDDHWMTQSAVEIHTWIISRRSSRNSGKERRTLALNALFLSPITHWSKWSMTEPANHSSISQLAVTVLWAGFHLYTRISWYPLATAGV